MKAFYVCSSALAFISSWLNSWSYFCNRCEDPTLAWTQLGNASLCFVFGFYSWLKFLEEFGKERK